MMDMEQRNAAISSMMQFVGGVSADKEVQLSLLAAVLVTACVQARVPKECALEAVEHFFDAQGDLVSLERPGRLH
jgi:hypothetical protein